VDSNTTDWQHTISKVSKGMVKGPTPGCAATTGLRRFLTFPPPPWSGELQPKPDIEQVEQILGDNRNPNGSFS